MSIPMIAYLFSFVPIVIFALVFWSDINRKKQFGKRPVYLLVSITLFALTGIIAALVGFFPSVFTGNSAVTQFSLFTLLYIITFFFLEDSIHLQRLVRSFFIDKFRVRLKPYFIFLSVLFFFGLLSILLFAFHTSLTGSISKAFSLLPQLKLQELEESGTLYLNDFGFLNTILLVVFSIITLIFMFTLNRSIFSFETEVIRRNLLLAVSSTGIFILLFILLIIRGLNTEFPLWIHVVNNICFITRIINEYFYQRTLNLDRLLAKQEQSLQVKNELITNVVNSPLEDDSGFIRKTVVNEIERARSMLAVHEHGITGTIVYTRNGDLLKVESIDQIVGFCIPIMRLDTIKLYKNIDQFNDVILRTPFDLRKINETPKDKITNWGEILVKEILETGKEQIISDVPAEAKGHQTLIGLYPVFDKEQLLGVIVFFKNAFKKLFPEEENALNNLVENLKVIFSIIQGKHIQQERNRLQGEMDIAKNIQTSILPKSILIEGFECATNMVTATEVGGDVFDYCPSPFGTYLGIGDVSGHGLPAGIMALIQLTAFQTAIQTAVTFKKAVTPCELYDLVNKILCEINRKRIGSDKFMTGNYFLLQNNAFNFAGTHLIALHFRKKENTVALIPELANRTAFLGISEYISSSTSEGSFSIASGDIFLLYTDGIIEAKDHASEQFGIERLKAVLLESAGDPLDKIIEKIMGAVRNHARTGDLKKYKNNLADDASLVVLRKQ